MKFILTLLNYSGYYDTPQGVVGWSVWLALAAFCGWLIYRWRGFHPSWNKRSGLILAVMIVLLPITALFVGLELPFGGSVPAGESSLFFTGNLMLPLLAIPWAIAAGLLGPLPAAGLALLSGTAIAYYNSHNPFIPLIYALLAILFSGCLQQNYRTWFFRMVSHPLVAAGLISLGFPVLFIASNLLLPHGSIGARLDYGIAHAVPAGVGFAGQVFIAAFLAEVLSLFWTDYWERKGAQRPSPAESSLEVRMVFTLAPVVVLIMIGILIGQWVSMVRTAQELLGNQMKTITQASAASIPVAMETGQNLINQLAQDQRLFATEDPEQLNLLLADYLNRVPFFNQLVFFGNNQQLLAGYPLSDINRLSLSQVEVGGISLALKDVTSQSYSLLPGTNNTTGRIVFISAVKDGDGLVRGVLLGRTTLDQNPFFTPILESLNSLSEIGGFGMILDEQGMVLFHPDTDIVGSYFNESIPLGQVYESKSFTTRNGSRTMINVEPVPGRQWSVVATIPSAHVQQTALNAGLPLLGWMVLLLIVGYGLLRIVVRVVIGSIGGLAEEARLIAGGDFDRPIKAKTIDEIGQLGVALEEMRKGLKARVEEANQLLTVSKGVASTLEMESAVNPILQGVMATGASAARLILTDAALPEFGQRMATEFSLGPSAERYADLDKQVLALTRQQPEVVLTNPARARLNNYGQPLPQALIGMALQHEGVFYGTLWVAYDEPKRFSQAEVRFVATVAGQAALAAANTRLYLSAELGRQRMEAILASTAEPVLVTDFQDNILLVNPAARELLRGEESNLVGRPVREAIEQKGLRDVLLGQFAVTGQAPVEVKFRDGRVFFATASPVSIEGKQMGRVCMMRDVTHYKELDSLKSEFVDTVSHDLRSPLTLMRGYVTMLQMVGELNEQQISYTNKIVSGIESMSELVNNLLDLGRIDAGVGLRLETVPAADSLKQVVEALRLTAIQKQIGLELHLPDGAAPLVKADKALLEQALHNLLDNAIRYTEQGGRVDVWLSEEDGRIAVFEIKDTGIGIAPVDLPRLFERFFRAAGQKSPDTRGSGLGLAIVKSIAERHGGSVQVESQLGRGSTFTLCIPLKHLDQI